ncbi:thioesterase domain-containing protein, partial [Salmonella enterica subsp. enterica serovar Montevideo]|nr:thioesterase domain-containing protein [Salmonella enterica subsp. enterica serovar Montevideo]
RILSDVICSAYPPKVNTIKRSLFLLAHPDSIYSIPCPMQTKLRLLDTWPPETQNWREKEANGLNPDVLAEIERERAAFVAAQQGNASEALFTAIEGNYADAVRLLTTAHSVPFDGHATLFVADKTVPEGVSPEQSWSPWIASLAIYHQPCAHVDIISPSAFETIGPIISELINK